MNRNLALSASLAVILCPSPAWAEEVEFRGCYTAEGAVIDKAGEVVIGMNVSRGVSDRVGGKFPAEKLTMDCRAVWTVSKAGLDFTNRCAFVDADGDRTLSVSTGTMQSFQWKWIAGTGKYAGITGGGTGSIDTPYPRASATLNGACWRGKGTWSIQY